MRATMATEGRASVTAGSTRGAGVPAPPTGSQDSQKANTTMRTRPVQNTGMESPNREPMRATASKSEVGHTADTRPASTPTTAAISSAATVSSSVAGHTSASSSSTGRFCWMDRPRSPRATRPTYSTYRTNIGLSSPRGSRSLATASGVACSPSISATASPGISSTVSMTTKTTPSSTGTASIRRRRRNVSIASGLLVEPDLPQPEVVLHRMDGEALHRGLGGHDLLGGVHRDPHHLLGQDVLHLEIELLALRLVQAAARLLHERVHPGVHVARRVPARGRRLLAVEERVEGVVRVGVRGHPAQREHVMVERVAAHLLEHRRPLEHLHLGLDPDFLEHGLDGLGDLTVLGIAAACGQPGERQALAALLHHAVGSRRPARLGEQRLGLRAIERILPVQLHVLVAEHAGRQHAQRGTGRAPPDVFEYDLPLLPLH